jgi:hypothetical protein
MQFYSLTGRTSTFDGDAFRRLGDSGVKAVLDVTAVPTVDTVQLVIEENIGPPQALAGSATAVPVWRQIAAATASAATGRQVLTVHPAVTPVANVAISDAPLDGIRVRVLHSGVGAFNYTLAVDTIP